MRKDLRTGAAIGGMLLAALVVYAVVTHRHGRDTQKVVLDTGKTAPLGGASAGADQPAPGSSGDSTRNRDSTTAGPMPLETIGGNPAADLNSRTGAGPSDLPQPVSGNSKTASWAVLLSAGTMESPANQRDDASATPASSGASGQRARRNQTSGSESRRSANDTAESGSSATTSGTNDSHDAPATSAARTHRVVENETFSSIARAVYGDAKYFKEIIKANPNVDPNRLKPGTIISLPDKSQFKHDAAPTTGAASSEAPRRHPSASTAIDSKTEYRVQANDNLYKISLKLYHSANRMDAIYQLNKSTIGPDPEKLKLDMILKLPEPPVETVSR